MKDKMAKKTQLMKKKLLLDMQVASPRPRGVKEIPIILEYLKGIKWISVVKTAIGLLKQCLERQPKERLISVN